MCNTNWDLRDATVVCRQLGYAIALSAGGYPGDIEFIWLDNIACTGYEANLTQCSSGGLGVKLCSSHRSSAGVKCSSKLSITKCFCRLSKFQVKTILRVDSQPVIHITIVYFNWHLSV